MSTPASRPPYRASLAAQLGLWTWLGALPASLLAAAWVWSQPWLIYPKVLLLTITGLAWLGGAWAVYRRTAFHLTTIGNLIEGITAGDYSQRLRLQAPHDGLARQVNGLVDGLHRQRLQAEAALRLVDSVVQGIDVAVFAFNAQAQLSLANPSAQALLQQSAEHLLGQSAEALGLQRLLATSTDDLQDHVFPGAAGLWRVRRLPYTVEGQTHTLLFVTDLKQVLRSQELEAWRRLLRVLSHEVNNALAPLASLGATLHKAVQTQPSHDAELQSDLLEGLTLIQDRATHVAEFVRRYSQLAHFPEPQRRVFDLAALLRRLPSSFPGAALEVRIDASTAELPFFGDPAQIEQLLVNLIKNAIEASAAPVLLQCQSQPLQISVLDRGPGIANPANLFVPFYTTKPQGTGIGLVLARQIAEAHQGSLQLQNRDDGPGCVAMLRFASATA